MTTIGYLRVSSDKQDLQKQEHLLLKYAQQHDLHITEFISIEISSRKTTRERRIDELMAKLNEGDTLLVAELSRLGRNMFEVINIINALSSKQVRIIFVRQPELSTTGTHGKLLLAIYSYFAETEKIGMELAMCMEALSTLKMFWDIGDDAERQALIRNLFTEVVFDLDTRRVVNFRLQPWADRFIVMRAEVYDLENGSKGNGSDGSIEAQVEGKVMDTANMPVWGTFVYMPEGYSRHVFVFIRHSAQ